MGKPISGPLPRAVSTAAVVAAGVGTAVLAVSAYQASGTVVVDDQARWGAVGLAGVAIAGIAAVMWTFQARQAVSRRRRALVAVVDAERAAPVPRQAGAATSALVASAAMARYHFLSCSLVAGKDVQPATRSDHQAQGRKPCGVCES
jgi:hypothetical protein